MHFTHIQLIQDEMVLIASATGHATDVINIFRQVADLIFVNQGAWRITAVNGVCPPSGLDSDMHWHLKAQLKVDH
jgi:hypothetical protein